MREFNFAEYEKNLDVRRAVIYPYESPTIGETQEFVLPIEGDNPLFKYIEPENCDKLMKLLKSLTMRFTLVAYGKHFDDDKESRYVYSIIIEREGKSISFDYGSSIRNTEIFTHKDKRRSGESHDQFLKRTSSFGSNLKQASKERREFFKGFLYDILTCIKMDGEGQFDSFESFCSDFGYDTDSRKAEKVFHACCTQRSLIRKIFTAEELSWFPS